ncbi:MAG: MEKHLA domain-containing protein [Verrucomicrobiota bacterium]
MRENEGTPWLHPRWIRQVEIFRSSYRHWLGKEFAPDCPTDPVAAAEWCFEAPFVLVSHDGSEDPILNYGNRAALDLWEVSLSHFIGMPSRMTAEPQEREERASALRRSQDQGWIEDYSGIRISSTGRRFALERATVWTLLEGDRAVGQAAKFSDWHFLED